MKIIHLFAYLGDGGAEAYALTLAKMAKANGHEPMFVFSRASDNAIDLLHKAGINYLQLNMESSFNPLSVFRSARLLRGIIEANGVDLVHTHMLREQSVAIIAKIIGAKTKLIRTFHRLDQFNWKFRLLKPIYVKCTDETIAISQSVADSLNENGWSGHFQIVENGVLPVQSKKHDLALGFIGRLNEEKGILQFIEANKEPLKTSKMVIAGDGPCFSKIKDVVKTCNLNIELLGNISDKDKFFEKISVLVLPSSTEALPLVVLEAYSCGLPVAAFDIESMKQLVKKQNGELVHFPEYKTLFAVAKRLVNNSKNYKKINEDLFKEKYSAEIMWRKTYKIYSA